MANITETCLNIIKQNNIYKPADSTLIANIIEKYKGKLWAQNQQIINAVTNDWYIKLAYMTYRKALDRRERYADKHYIPEIDACVNNYLYMNEEGLKKFLDQKDGEENE